MAQTQRNDAIKRLESGKMNVLVATDVASRGLDLDDITHVFNFDLPRTADVYLHRIGRTGRAGRKGIAISLVEAHDHPLLGKIGRYVQEPIKYRVIAELRPETKAPSLKATFKPSKKVLAKRKAKKKKRKKQLKKKCGLAIVKILVNVAKQLLSIQKKTLLLLHQQKKRILITNNLYSL